MVDAAVRPIDDENGKDMRGKTDAANRLSNREPKFDERSGSDHKEEIGCAVHRLAADVPDDAVPACEVLGIAHEHGCIFKRRDGKINITRRIIKRGGEEEEGDEEVEDEDFF